MTALNTNLTANETKAALILVRSCLDGMGGQRPADLGGDEYTWVSAKDLMAAGYSAASANATFGSLMEKGFVSVNGKNEWVLNTAAWQYLDTIWDAQNEQPSDLVMLATVTGVAAEYEAAKEETGLSIPANFIVRVFTDEADLGSYPLNAASAGDAIKEARAAVKLAGISRKVGVIHYRAKKA